MVCLPTPFRLVIDVRGTHRLFVVLLLLDNFYRGIEGAIGSMHKVDASYLSPHVNIAARMQAAASQYGKPLLMSGPFVNLLSDVARRYCRKVLWLSIVFPCFVCLCVCLFLSFYYFWCVVLERVTINIILIVSYLCLVATHSWMLLL